MKNKQTECLVCGSHNIEINGATYKCNNCGAVYTETEISKCEHCDGDTLTSNAIFDDGLYYCSENCYNFLL